MRDFFIAKISQARSESNDMALQMADASLKAKIDLFRVAAYEIVAQTTDPPVIAPHGADPPESECVYIACCL